jgi:predicted aldo/keto reductase-like oxidoreductase
MYKDLDTMRRSYGWLEEEARASACVECGDCEKLCPQNIEIIEWLEKAHELLGAEG